VRIRIARATIENAATVVYVLGPINRNERLTRQIGYRSRTVVTSTKVSESLASGRPSEVERRIANLATTFAARGLDPDQIKKPIGYGTILGDAAEFSDKTPGQAKAMWRMLSGLTHGEQWAGLAITDHQRRR
jgi:hypothetical protein